MKQCDRTGHTPQLCGTVCSMRGEIELPFFITEGILWSTPITCEEVRKERREGIAVIAPSCVT